jgi:myosin-1
MSFFLITLGIQEIGELVGLNSEELERALCSRTMETAKEKVVTELTVIQVRAFL